MEIYDKKCRRPILIRLPTDLTSYGKMVNALTSNKKFGRVIFAVLHTLTGTLCTVYCRLRLMCVVGQEGPYGFSHDFGDGDVSAFRPVNVLLDLVVEALWDDETSISTSRHAITLFFHC